MEQQYVSRGGQKLESVAQSLGLDFRGKIVLDVGSSTGGFSDYALQHGAERVIAIDSGANQLHPRLRLNQKIELHEKTDIRDLKKLSATPQVVVIDVSFISLRSILPSLIKLIDKDTVIVAMVKPQFETHGSDKHRGIVKNERVRREILKDFEMWAKSLFVLLNKTDSGIRGTGGNLERFYLLQKL